MPWTWFVILNLFQDSSRLRSGCNLPNPHPCLDFARYERGRGQVSQGLERSGKLASPPPAPFAFSEVDRPRARQRLAFSGATVIRTVSPERPGKSVNIASTRLGTR